MKANAPKRKIFDAVDMLTADVMQVETRNGFQSLPIDRIKPFSNHPFHLYEGERLDDMVESIREYGVLVPVIVRKKGRRNDILHEIEEIGTCGHGVHKSRSRDGIGEEYGMTGRNIARYMRVDKLIRPFKDRLDAGDLTLTAAVELSYLSEEEQKAVAAQESRINEKMAKAIRAEVGKLTEEKLEGILHPVKGSVQRKPVTVKMPAEAEEKYFSGMKAQERTELVMQALETWFAGKEAADVQQ